jgi:3-hydroxyisobutyrate dehydrogenase-like beta-hydroxyacid dehydrogenase
MAGESITIELKRVQETLLLARRHGLEAEVMYSALTMAAEANEHGQTMEQVLDAALGEWDI